MTKKYQSFDIPPTPVKRAKYKYIEAPVYVEPCEVSELNPDAVSVIEARIENMKRHVMGEK